MTKKHKRWLLLSLITVGAVAIVSTVLSPSEIEVDTAVVDRGALNVTVEEQGRTRARYRYTISAPVAGQLLRTDVDEGDIVEVGAVLAQIAPPPEDARNESAHRAQLAGTQARRREANARVAEARSNLELTRSEAKRRADLYERGLIGIETRDRFAKASDLAKARLTSAQAALAAADADVSSARARLIGVESALPTDSFTMVIAPVGGTVLHVYEESERIVPSGAPLFDLSKGDELEIVIDLLTQDAVKVHAGDPIEISGWGGKDTVEGKVRQVEPGAFTKISTLGVEEQRVNVIGDFIEAPLSLGAEFRIEAAIIIWTGDNVLRVPTTAIFRRNNSWHTYVIDNGRARLRPIEIGQRSTDYAEVVGGIDKGHTVILFPSDLISDGVRVSEN